MFDITISIVNWNTGPLLDRCLASLEAWREGLSLQVIVVDNNSSDKSARQAQQKHAAAEFIYCSDNRGFSHGNNLALSKAQGRYFLLLNPDTEVHPASLYKMKTFLDDNPGAGAVGPRLEYGDGSLQRSWSGWLVSPRTILAETLGWKWMGTDPLGNKVPEDNIEVKGLMGACIMVRKEAIDTVGPMDENFFLVYEEADWCHRLIERRWTVWYMPSVLVTHYTGQSSQHIPGKGLVESYQSLRYYLAKHYGKTASRMTMLALTAIYLWWTFKTIVKTRMIGSTPALEERRTRFGYILKGLLTTR